MPGAQTDCRLTVSRHSKGLCTKSHFQSWLMATNPAHPYVNIYEWNKSSHRWFPELCWHGASKRQGWGFHRPDTRDAVRQHCWSEFCITWALYSSILIDSSCRLAAQPCIRMPCQHNTLPRRRSNPDFGWVGWREGGSHILEADLREVVERNIWNRFIWENKASRAPHYPARQRQHSLSSAQWHPNPYAPSLTWHRVNGMARPSACCRGLATPGGTRSILTFLSGDASSLLLPSAGAHDNLTVAPQNKYPYYGFKKGHATDYPLECPLAVDVRGH